MPKGYSIHKHTIPENSVLIHTRNRGVIEVSPKLKFAKIHLPFFKSKNLDGIAEKIVNVPNLVYELAWKNNFGDIITNGTAVLILVDIEVLAGMPVMERKSVLFKYFGGTNIFQLCIQEKNVDKLITYAQRIAPVYTIIYLEDIQGPDRFIIENKLIESIECPMFHNDQHGTACVAT